MLKGLLLYHQSDAAKNKAYIQWFIDEAQLMHIDLKLAFYTELKLMLQQIKPNFIINRTRHTLTCELIETYHISVFNSRQVTEIFNDKYKTYQMLKPYQIPMQDTYLIKKPNDQVDIAFPFVAKPLDGHGGNDVSLIQNRFEWEDYKNQHQTNYIIQSTQHIQFGKDLRVFVIGKTIIAAVLRENDKDFRANYTRGGTAKLYQLNYNETILIQKIINLFEFDYVGIDFLINKTGQLIFNEIEDVVGSRILSLTTDINIARRYLAHIVKKITEQHSS